MDSKTHLCALIDAKMESIAPEFIEKRSLNHSVGDVAAVHGRGTSSGTVESNSESVLIESLIAVL